MQEPPKLRAVPDPIEDPPSKIPDSLLPNEFYAIKHTPTGLFFNQDYWHDMRELVLSTVPLLYASYDHVRGELYYGDSFEKRNHLTFTDLPFSLPHDVEHIPHEDFEIVKVTLSINSIS